MRVPRNLLMGLVLLALLYGAVLLAERWTTQELTRVSEANTQEAVCLMWKPRFLRGDGICSVDLRNAQDKVLDTAGLGTLDTAFNALQKYGQLGFQGQEVTVANLQTGELARRFIIRDVRLVPSD